MARSVASKKKSKQKRGSRATKRQKKISKPRRKVQAKNTNPKRSLKKTGRSRRTPGRNFYTVGDDALILSNLSGKETVSSVAVKLAPKLNRKSESVRDRIKKYLNKLPESEKRQIRDHAKRSSKDYVFFKQSKGQKRIDKICSTTPALCNRTFKRKSKKKQPPKKVSHVDFDWLKDKIYNRDPYFALEHQVQFLSDFFNHLIHHHHVQHADIVEFIAETNTDCSLDEILQSFQIELGH